MSLERFGQVQHFEMGDLIVVCCVDSATRSTLILVAQKSDGLPLSVQFLNRENTQKLIACLTALTLPQSPDLFPQTQEGASGLVAAAHDLAHEVATLHYGHVCKPLEPEGPLSPPLPGEIVH